jgi:hypothetical protein
LGDSSKDITLSDDISLRAKGTGYIWAIAAQWFNINPLSHKCALLNAPYFIDHIKFQQINFSLNLVKLVQNFIYKSMIPSRKVYKILQQLD